MATQNNSHERNHEDTDGANDNPKQQSLAMVPQEKEENTLFETSPAKTPRIVYISACLTQLAVLSIGYDFGVNSGAMLLAEDVDYLELNSLWKQLIIAGALPSAIIVTIFASQLSDIIGRKKTVITAAVCYTIGSIITGSANNRVTILLGRLCIGCGFGFTGASTAVYIAECAPQHIRGRLIGLSQPFLTIGILSAAIISGIFSYDKENGWRYMWGFQGIWSVIQFIGLLFMPESPRWLIQKSQLKEAEKVLIKIRNTTAVDEEIYEIKRNWEEMKRSYEMSGNENVYLRMIKTPSVRRALLIGCAMHFFSQFSGANTVIYYSGIIIKMTGVGDVSAAIWNSALINCINLVFSIVGVWLVDVLGRRTLAIVGLFGLAFSSSCIATTFLFAHIYSPSVNTTLNIPNNSCSAYTTCDTCIHDYFCGFCFETTNDDVNGACLPISFVSMHSATIACNFTTLPNSYFTWAYDYCPISFSWVAIVGLSLFLVFYAQSMGPLPWTINAEIYPLWARSTGNGIGATVCWVCNLIISVTFLSLTEAINSYGVFYIMSIMAITGSVFCYFLLPETKGKTLEVIEMLFMPKNKKESKESEEETNKIEP